MESIINVFTPGICTPFSKETQLSEGYKLCRAAWLGDLADWRSLLENCDAKTKDTALMKFEIDDYGNRVTPLICAAMQNHLYMVKELVEKYKVPVDQTGSVRQSCNMNEHLDGVSALHCAAANENSLPVISFLIAKGANVNHRAAYNMTPLMTACHHGHVDTVKYLLNNGSDMRVAHTFLQHTCLVYAVVTKRTEVVNLLLEQGADPNSQSQSGQTALHLAAQIGSIAMLRSLLKHGALFKLVDDSGYTALEFACEAPQPLDVLDFLHRELQLNPFQVIPSYELAGACQIFNDHIIDGLNRLERGRQMRFQYHDDVIKKVNIVDIKTDPVVYGYCKEFETAEEFEGIDKDNDTAAKQLALMVMERILGADKVLLPSEVVTHLCCEASRFLCSFQFDKCISIYTKALKIQLNNNKGICDIIQLFTELFGQMLANKREINDNLVVTILEHCLMDIEEQWLKVQHIDYKAEVQLAYHIINNETRNALCLIILLKILMDEQDEHIVVGLVRRLVNLKIGHLDNMQSSLLHIACSTTRIMNIKLPNYNLIKLLLEQNVEIDAVNCDGNTPLHLIASSDCHDDETLYSCMELLITHGAHLDQLNNQRARPLDLANPVVLYRLKEATRMVSLKCLSAQTIKISCNHNYKQHLPKELVTFVEKH